MDGTVCEVRAEPGAKLGAIEGPVLLAPHTYGPDSAYVPAIQFRTRISEGKCNRRRSGVL